MTMLLIIYSLFMVASNKSNDDIKSYFALYRVDGAGMTNRVWNNPRSTDTDTVTTITGTGKDTTRVAELGNYFTVTADLTASAGSPDIKLEIYTATDNQIRQGQVPPDAEFLLMRSKASLTADGLVWNLHDSAYALHKWYFIVLTGNAGNGTTKGKLTVSTRDMKD